MSSDDLPEPVELEFFARAEHLSDVRKLVERLSGKTKLNRDQRTDFLTAADEAVTNAIRHGSPNGERSLIRVSCRALSDSLIVEVRDQGAGFAAGPAPAMPSPDSPGGRGLPMMCALADSVEIASSAKGTTITLKKIVR